MIEMWLGGESYAPKNRETMPVMDPMTGLQIDSMICASSTDVEQAFTIAKFAQEKWQIMDADRLEKIFFRAADCIEKSSQKLSQIIVRESGSTLSKSLHEVHYGAKIIRAAAGEARRLYGEMIPDDKSSRFSVVSTEPVGVVGVISPFNAPMALFCKMFAFPLAAGNTLVVKPSEHTPQIAIEVAKIFSEAGLPSGVFNVLQGNGKVGQQIVEHTHLNALTFTGSSEVGKAIGQTLGERLIPLHLELGGNNPLLILEDFDLDEAIDLATFGSFFHAGQICMASSRILIEQSIYDKFKLLFLERCENLYLGDLSDPETFYGPLIDKTALNKALQNIEQATDAGAQLLCGGQIQDELRLRPTVFEGVRFDSNLWTKETFAPIVSLTPFNSIDEGVSLANDSNYGLSAGVLTNNYRKGIKIAKRLQTGGVHLGSHPFQSGTMTPVGGTGLSGVGKSGGKYSIEHFTRKKWISFNEKGH